MRDVLDCLVESVDHPHREDRGEVFGVPVFLGRGLHARYELARRFVASQLDAFVVVNLRQLRQHLGGDPTGNEQRLHGVARAQTLRFGVVGDAHCLVDVGLVVDVDVAHAVEVLDHRNARLPHHALDQAFAAARHYDVNVLVHAQQLADRGAVGGRYDLHRSLGQPGAREPFVHARRDRLIGMDRF